MTTSRAWTTTYLVSWAVAMAPVGFLVVLAWTAEATGGSDVWWWLGLLGGAIVGLAVAAGTRNLGWLHRALRVLGPVLFVGGVVAAVAMYLESGVQHRTGQWLAGLGEFLLALLGLAVALIGGCLWLAGISGPRGWASGATATAA